MGGRQDPCQLTATGTVHRQLGLLAVAWLEEEQVAEAAVARLTPWGSMTAAFVVTAACVMHEPALGDLPPLG
jgi:hypothetical protein